MWRKSNVRPAQLPSEQQILSQLEMEKEEISKIQKQRDIIGKVQESILKKDQEIERLTSLVEKYRPYYEHCSTMRVELAEKESALRAYAKENALLRRQFEELLAESQHLSAEVKALQMEKQNLVRERHSIQRVNRQIEETFKEYQIQCRRRQQELIREMQECRKQVINYQAANQELRQMKEAYQEQHEEGGSEDLKLLESELAEKDRELQKAKSLNHQLSVEFDKSVNKICEFQRELNNYRVENHELKKTLGLVLQQDKYQKLQQKYMKRKDQSPFSESQEDDSQLQSSPEMSQLKL